MIYITQLLCPQRHCIIACAWDDVDCSCLEAEGCLKEKFHQLVNTGELNPFCGLCKSEVLHPVHLPLYGAGAT